MSEIVCKIDSDSINEHEEILINSGWRPLSSFTWNNDGYYSFSDNPTPWPSQATFEKFKGYGKLFFRFILGDSSQNVLFNEVAPAYYASDYWEYGKSFQGGMGHLTAMVFGGAVYPMDARYYFRISGTKSFIDAGMNNRYAAFQLVGIK